VWQDTPVMAAGWSDRFLFYADGSVTFGYSTMKELGTVQYLYGTYAIENSLLRIEWTKRTVYKHSSEIEETGGWGYSWSEATPLTEDFEAHVVSVFPIGEIREKVFGGSLKRLLMPIGGVNFFQFSDNPAEGLKL
jgi:hypothetical protein